jgi:hypothetical protein
MRTKGIFAGAALLALAACGGQQAEEPLTVSEINVEADLSAVGSREAVSYWQNIGQDLQAAMAAEFVGQTSPDGYIVNVDVDEITLADAIAADLTAQDATLAGRVEVVDPTSGVTQAAYNVAAASGDVQTYLPEGTDVVSVPRTSPEYYQAVLQAFARGAAAAVQAGGA